MKIFLSVSYSSKVDALGKVLDEYRAELEETIAIFEKDDVEVFCAPREDGWKLNEASPAEAFDLDVKNIDECDVLLAFVGMQVSAGIQLEIGFALAKGKRIVLASKSGEKLSYINQGLVDTDRAEIVVYDSQTDLISKLKQLNLK